MAALRQQSTDQPDNRNDDAEDSGAGMASEFKGIVVTEGKGAGTASDLKGEDPHGQGLLLGACRGAAGAAFGGRACDGFAASSRSTTTVFPEHFAEELSNMRSQLDAAIREYRSREDRLIAHLLEQAATGNVPKEEHLAQPSSFGLRPAPAPIAVDPALHREEYGDLHPLSPSTNGIVASPSEGGSQSDRPRCKRKSARRSASNVTGISQTMFQHTMSLEVVDLMEDMLKRHHRRTSAHAPGEKRTCRDSFESFAELSLIKVLSSINRCLHLQEPERSGRLACLVRSKYWDVLVCSAIFINAIFMIFQVDWQFSNYKSQLELPVAMQGIEMGLIVFFLLEMVIKIAVHRLYYFLNDDMRWNLFDFFLVMLSLYDLIIENLGREDAGGNITFFRSLRILKMTRVLRVVRVLKFAGQLRRMLLSILGSMTSLFWAFAVLFFVFYMFGILAVQSLSSKLFSVSSWMPPEEFVLLEEQITQYFGSVSAAMLTYFMATTGGNDWSVFYSVLVEVSEFDAAVLIFVVGFTQIALFNVLTGIFVENAMKVGKPDRDSLALERRREELKEAKAFRSFLHEKIDRDCSGTITFEEFANLAQNPRVSAVFMNMGLDVKDAKLFFDMIEWREEDAEMNIDFVVDACMKMKGPATSLDVQSLLYKMDQLTTRVDRLALRTFTLGSPKEIRVSEASEERATPTVTADMPVLQL